MGDGPDKDLKPGDKYSITLTSTDPVDTPVRWVKDEDGAEMDDGEDDFYCVTGPFNEWDADRMEDGPITGLRTITLEVPESGEIEFRFLKNGDEDRACSSHRSTSALGKLRLLLVQLCPGMKRR